MDLLYKPDWDATKERFTAWWAGEVFGRCAIAVTAPKDGLPEESPPPMPSDPVQRWTDLEYIAAANDYRHRRTFHGGEAFPTWHGGYAGHTSVSTWLGCEVVLDMRTGWKEPILTGTDWSLDDIRLDRGDRYYRHQLELLETAVSASRGKSVPGVGAFGGCGDTLAAIRGTMRLLADVMDRPDLVRETELHLMGLWIECYQAFYDIVQDAEGGSTAWFALWAPGKFYPGQCDFSYMISPTMFADLFIPTIQRQLEFLDYSVFHVDGIEAFAHVPLLCELDRLQCLQILPGAGKPNPLHYMDVLKQVQAAGKNLHISIPCVEVETALTELSARGLFIATSCSTEAEARQLLANAEKWSHD